MEFIQPAEITSKIMTLMDDADLKLVIVSPYNNFYRWIKFKKHLTSAIKRNVNFEYYIRDQKDIDFKQFEDFGITPKLIKDLHAKIYLNEKYAIISSMNIIEYSDNNSIDFAYKTETSKEYNEINSFLNKFIIQNNRLQDLEQREALTESEINNLEKLIIKRFPNSKITNSKTYLFSKDMFTGFEVSISNEVQLKRKIFKPIDEEKFNEMYGECYRILSKSCTIKMSTIEKRYYATIIPHKIIYDKDRYGCVDNIISELQIVFSKILNK